MKLGIIGHAQCGKTTVFEAITQNPLDNTNLSENRISTISVPDERVERLSDMYSPQKTTFAQVEYFLPGKNHGGESNKGQDQWQATRDCDALIHVVRNFSTYGISNPSPLEDFNSLQQELMIADQVVVEKRLEKMELEKRKSQKFNPEEFALLQSCLASLEQEFPLRDNNDLASAPLLRGYAFMSAKPMLVLFNNEDDDQGLPAMDGFPQSVNCLTIRGKLEQELSQMDPDEKAELLREFDIAAPATDRVIKASYGLMGLISFFTVGEDEVRAWTIRNGTIALDAAEVIHSDIKKGFIRAEVVAYDDLVAAGSHAEARKQGLVRLEGKTYRVQDGDVAHFRFNV